ncbi:MAG: DUF262 and DUF1524 domain-containing protein [bacterium]|nr:DUF262 and DUF1524 domain-containing protein [bacterium]
MKAKETKLLNFLKQSPQFVIPVYQRTYSWTKRECQQLWEDILRTGRDDQINAHFVGSIVYIEESIYTVTVQPSLLVIDGQQRLTTTMLILEALARRLGDKEPVNGFTSRKLREHYLLNHLEEGDQRFKLVLTQTDKESLHALVGQKPSPREKSLRITENFNFFEKQIAALGDDLTLLCQGLLKLMIVDIALSRDQDNPQLIFESMNSTGRELSQADLIRNFVLMGLETTQQKCLYEDYWRPMEITFGQEAYGEHFDKFIRHYLTLCTGNIPNFGKVYEAFKAHARQPRIEQAGIEALIADIRQLADYYYSMALEPNLDGRLGKAFRDLRELRVEVAYPFLLELYRDYHSGELSEDDFYQAVRLIESYVFRRSVCKVPTNSLNKTFATFGRHLKKDRYLESIKDHFLSMQSYRRFPSDEEFKRELQHQDVYNFQNCSYLFRRLEHHKRKEQIFISEYTIEHIMPQNKNLSAQWQSDLGSDWQQIQEKYLHTLGNLTLTGYNSEYGDRSFAEKRDMQDGFKDSPLWLNKNIGIQERWNESAITARAEFLANRASEVWIPVFLPEERLAEYRALSEQTPASSYSIEDHSNLSLGSASRMLFDVLRKEVLALSPVVTEEFLKLYIAYKAETNFVDVIPQTSRLRLLLNISFQELHDPRGLARDMDNLEMSGNGDVEVFLSNPEELRYVMALVRQAFEKQMGNGNDEA